MSERNRAPAEESTRQGRTPPYTAEEEAWPTGQPPTPSAGGHLGRSSAGVYQWRLRPGRKERT